MLQSHQASSPKGRGEFHLPCLTAFPWADGIQLERPSKSSSLSSGLTPATLPLVSHGTGGTEVTFLGRERWELAEFTPPLWHDVPLCTAHLARDLETGLNPSQVEVLPLQPHSSCLEGEG